MMTVCYFYRIISHYFSYDEFDHLLVIENIETQEQEKISLLKLANNLNLLMQFIPEDIFSVAYFAAQYQIRKEQHTTRSKYIGYVTVH